MPADILTNPEAMKKFQDAQNTLGGALRQLLVVVERYPDIKSGQNFLALQSQIEGTENRISIARRDYIQAVRQYNTEITTFPGRLWKIVPLSVRAGDGDVRHPAGGDQDAEGRFRHRQVIPLIGEARGCARAPSACPRLARCGGCTSPALRSSCLRCCCRVRRARCRAEVSRAHGQHRRQRRSAQPEDRAAIEADLKALEGKSTDQLVVVTVPSLQGYEIEDFGYQLGRKWGIGQRARTTACC